MHHGCTEYTARVLDQPNKQDASSSHLPDLFVMQFPMQGAEMRILVPRELGVGGGAGVDSSGKLIWFTDPKSALEAEESGVKTYWAPLDWKVGGRCTSKLDGKASVWPFRLGSEADPCLGTLGVKNGLPIEG